MNEQQEPIPREDFNKVFEKVFENDIQTFRTLENYLECAYTAYDTCHTLTILCIELENVSPEGMAYTKQRMQDYYAECETKLKKVIPHHTNPPLNFDDLPQLKTELYNLRHNTDGILSLIRDANNAFQRYPELLYTLQCMEDNGIPTDDIDASLKNTDAELEEVLASEPFPNEGFKKFVIKMNSYCIQVQKLEHWIHQKAIETSIVIAPQTPPAPIAPQEPTDLVKRMQVLATLLSSQEQVLSTLLSSQVQNTEVLIKLCHAAGLLHTDLSNEIRATQNFRYNADNRLKNIENQTAFLAANMPSSEQTAAAIDAAKCKAQRLVSDDDALGIMKATCKEYAVNSRQTLINWRKAGYEPVTGKIITDMAFSSLQAWVIWCQEFYTEMEKHTEIQKSIQKHTKTQSPNTERQQ